MRKGFTLIELLAVIVILAVIALIATPIILGIISNAKKEAFKATAYGIIDAAKNEYVREMYSSGATTDITFTYANNVESSNITGKSLSYSGAKPKDGTVLLTSNGDVAIAIHDGIYCAYKSYSDREVTVDSSTLSECIIDYSVAKGVNVPKLAQGMTPIKWDGSKWIETNISDKDWYSYDTTNKKWANARTADGSMWVWIPRYAYRITSGWHSNSTGTIEVQFSKGIKDDWKSEIDKDTTAAASNATIGHESYNGGKYTDHPAFWWNKDGDTLREEGEELTGIWVAKFEATAVEGISSLSSCNALDNSVIKTIKVIPNATSWRCISIVNMFTNIRNMETKSIYGWATASGLRTNGTFETDNNNLDTHLMKNVEWGVVAYLSKSQYGKNTEEIYINNSQTYTTGCAGNTASAGTYERCQNSYESIEGIKASTTGSIYGIYDISGGSKEYISAYIDDGNTSSNIVFDSLPQYKDAYPIITDNRATNYEVTSNFKGDAIWETSNSYGGSNSWFGDYSNIPDLTGIMFMRGGGFFEESGAGAFSFTYFWGPPYIDGAFRPVLLIDTGL